jgi:hypothetical protein
VKSLINFIELFDGLRSAYQGRDKFWDIDVEDRRAIVEIISVLSPVRDIIVLAQSNKGALVPYVVGFLTDLRMDMQPCQSQTDFSISTRRADLANPKDL